jgi:hypothetical protein
MMKRPECTMNQPTDRTGPGPLRRLLSGLESPGLTSTQERILNVVLALVIVTITSGWAVAIAGAAREGEPLRVGGELTANPLRASSAPPAAFVLDRLVRGLTDEGEWRGRSGAVRALIVEPGDTLRLADTLGLDSLPSQARLEAVRVDSPGVRAGGGDAGTRPGAWSLLIRLRDEVRELTDVAVLTPVPSERIADGRIGQYVIGEWPSRSDLPAKLRTPAYDAPRGLIAVTPENRDLPISEHLVLGDFLTKGQDDVWPKYVAVSPRILDKLELTFQEMERRGHPVENVGIISGFRTPHYNAYGGSTSGRGSASRHMYGDAMDLYIDNDGNGGMDDLNGDGQVTKADARVLAEAADAVERQYPEYVGGIGVYGPNSGAHSGFVHIDGRGYRARW